MSACRSLTKYLFYFFNHKTSDDKQDESPVTTQVKPVIEPKKSEASDVQREKSVVSTQVVNEISMLDFLRSYAGDVIARVQEDNLCYRAIATLDLLLKDEKNPEIRDKIRKETDEHRKHLERYMSIKETSCVPLLLGLETDPGIRIEIIEWIQNRMDKHSNSLYIAWGFLSESEKTEKMKNKVLFFSKNYPDGMVLRFNVLEDEKQRIAIINELTCTPRPNLNHIIPFLADVIENLSSKEARMFLPILGKAFGLYGNEGYNECLRRQALHIIERMRDLHHVTIDEFRRHKIQLEPVGEADFKTVIANWVVFLKNILKDFEPLRIKNSLIYLLAKAVSHSGNDEVLLLLIEYFTKSTTTQELLDYFSRSNRKLTEFSLYSKSNSLAISQVFKKGYPFASAETKEKIHQFLLDQFIYLHEKVGTLAWSYLNETGLVDLLKFVMTEMKSEGERVRYLDNLLKKREATLNGSEASLNPTIPLITHCIHLYNNQLKEKMQVLGSVLDNENNPLPNELRVIIKGYALSL
jgi:hypothetical protein